MTRIFSGRPADSKLFKNLIKIIQIIILIRVKRVTRMMRIFFNDFQLNFLKILSGATLLYESYSFDSRDSCSFFFNTNCTNDTNIILLDF